VLEAAELVAYDVLVPALRSRGRTGEHSRELYDEGFHGGMSTLFIVRARFDALEDSFAHQHPHVLDEAAEQRESKDGSMARVLDEFAAGCVSKIVNLMHEMLAEFD